MIWYSKPQQSRDKTWDLTKPKKCKAQENINLFTNTAFHVHLQNQKNSLTWTTQSDFSLIIFVFFCEENTSYPRDTGFLLQEVRPSTHTSVFSPVSIRAIYSFVFILFLTAVTLLLFCLFLKKVHLIQEQHNYFFPPCPHFISITYMVADFWIE